MGAEPPTVSACQSSVGSRPWFFLLLCGFVQFPLERDAYLGFMYLTFLRCKAHIISVFGMQIDDLCKCELLTLGLELLPLF